MAKVFSLVSCNPCAKLSRGEVGLGGEGGAGEARQGGEGGAGEGEGAISVPVAGCWLTARGDCSGLPAPPRNPGIFHYHHPQIRRHFDCRSAHEGPTLFWGRNLAENGGMAGWPLAGVPPPFTAACWGVDGQAGEQSVIYTFIGRPQKNLYPGTVSHQSVGREAFLGVHRGRLPLCQIYKRMHSLAGKSFLKIISEILWSASTGQSLGAYKSSSLFFDSSQWLRWWGEHYINLNPCVVGGQGWAWNLEDKRHVCVTSEMIIVIVFILNIIKYFWDI